MNFHSHVSPSVTQYKISQAKMNNTLISILIFTLFLLPIAFAKFRLDIFAFEESGYLDSVTLSGKNTSEGEVKKMSRELNDPGSVLYCMGDSTGSFHTWTVDANLCKISTAFFAGVTSISFDHATKDPRPLNITIAETKMQVRTLLIRC
jgi:hypothetical protein